MKPDTSSSAVAAKSSGERAPLECDGAGGKKLMLRLEAAGFGSVVVLHCEGRVIFRNEARLLCGILTEVLPVARCVVVDLGGVASLDSGALGELVMTQMWAEAAGFELKFSCASDLVRRLFESTNLISVFDVYSSVEAAVAALRQHEVRTA